MTKKSKKHTTVRIPHIFLATPMYGGQCMGGYMQSVLSLQVALNQKGWDFSFMNIMNDALIQRARNYLVYKFLESEATHLLFIDADIVFNPDDVIKMIEADQDIICGMYPKKFIWWDKVAELAQQGTSAQELPFAGIQYVFNVKEDGDQLITFGDHLVEIRHGGTGYMLIRRNVFEKIIDEKLSQNENGSYVNDYYLNDANKIFYDFFSIGVEKQMLLSEDWYFCDEWSKLGGQIYLAAWAIARHIGTYVFG